MKVYKDPSLDLWSQLVQRPVQDFQRLEEIVDPILRKVQRKGDKALYKFAREYEHVELESLLVTPEEIAAAGHQVPEDLKQAIQVARENIEKFHAAQQPSEEALETFPGVFCYRKAVPIEKVGLYIPGGTAPLFSTVLMLGIPAKIAGCKEIVIASPANHTGSINPVILYTAGLIGINTIVKAGGAQAIAAMAYGTESVPRVDKIFGPGNQYVTAAKQVLSKYGVAIDMPAGPSEVAVLADDTAIPSFVASDLLSQAEHGVDSQVMLIATSENLLEETLKEVKKQVEHLPRKATAKKALENSTAVLFKNMEQAIAFTNAYAAEHLIIATADDEKVAAQIQHAGSVFLGNFTPESAGDYASGTNHTLPTNGFARAFSGVSLDSYFKKITFQRLNPQGIKGLGPSIEKLAAAEMLDAHKNAVSIRLKYISDNGL